MKQQPDFVIGAISGSGSRVLTTILKTAGYYTGNDLNSMGDCLHFNRLFKNPDWFFSARPEQIVKRLELFHQLMENRPLDDVNQRQYKQTLASSPNLSLSAEAQKRLLEAPTDCPIPENQRWGWMEPNTQFYMRAIRDFYPDTRFIYVVRDGLSLAFSKNIQQLKIWGPYLGFEQQQAQDIFLRRRQQLAFWNAVIPEIIKQGQEIFGHQFTVLSYETFCAQPRETLQKLFALLDYPTTPSQLEELVKPLRMPVPKFQEDPEDLFGKELMAEHENICYQIQAY
jgi:hypothetical protein